VMLLVCTRCTLHAADKNLEKLRRSRSMVNGAVYSVERKSVTCSACRQNTDMQSASFAHLQALRSAIHSASPLAPRM
jgi:hypothetical protein